MHSLITSFSAGEFSEEKPVLPARPVGLSACSRKAVLLKFIRLLWHREFLYPFSLRFQNGKRSERIQRWLNW